MKKYTKKLVAFLLAVAMVLTGLPMSATEVKAADDSFVLDICRPTTGAILTSDTTNTLVGISNSDLSSAGAYWLATTSLAGDGWRLNPSKTTIPTTEEGGTIYQQLKTGSPYTSGAQIQGWKGGNTVFGINQSNTVAFDFTVPQEGTYAVEATYYNRAASAQTDIKIGDNYSASIPLGTDDVKAFDTILLGTVTLSAGDFANTVEISQVPASTANSAKAKSTMLRSLTFRLLDYGSASLNVEEGAEFIVGDTITLETTATMTDGTDISGDISVVYASTDEGVATITDGVMNIVGAGNVAITATVSYNGVQEEVVTRNITVFPIGTLHLDFAEVDVTTLTDDGQGRYYYTTGTKSAESAGMAWSYNAEKSDDEMVAIKNEDGSVSNAGTRTYLTNGAATHIQIMSGAKYAAIDFEIPTAGIYNLSVDLLTVGEKYGYLSFIVDDVFMGTIDCYPGNPTVQNLLSIELAEGTHTLKMISPGSSSGTDDYAAISRINFLPTDEANARQITALELTVDPTEYDMANATTGQLYYTYETTNNDVILRADWNFSTEDKSVAVVSRTGKVTPAGKGETNLVVSMHGVSASVPVKVTDSRPRYTVTWLNEDGSEFATSELLEGATIAYKGDAPVKEATAQYSYTFAGWVDLEGNPLAEGAVMGTEPVSYKATYTETVNEYKVSFVVNGEAVKEETLPYGETPVAPEVGDIEIEGVAYIFKGWDAEIVPVTGEVTYTAVLEAQAQSYTITFVDEDGETLYETTVAAGELPIYKGEEPTKAATAQYTYKFAGWSPEVVEATVGATYTATYEATVNEYTVTWVVDGKEISETYAYGATPEFKGVAEKAKDAQYTYTFAGWDPVIASVTGNATYTAQFDKIVNKYLVTFRDADGSLIKSEEVAYGEVPTCEEPVKEEDVYATYTFAGWSPEVVAVEREAVYQATYEATPKSYTVTWVVDGVATEETYEAGSTPEFKGSTDKAADAQFTYEFAGWDADLVEVTADVTYTAQYTQTPVTYIITWVNHNGETIATDELTWGATPEAPVATYKDYAFLAWDKEIAVVEGEATYTAIYDIDGIDEDYYYVDGILQSENAQLIEIDGKLYYVQHSGAIKKDGNQTISKIRTNGYVEAGTYYFNAEGVMRNPADDLKGTIGEDGYYYVNDEVRKNVGLVEIDGYYYYVQYSGKVVKAQNMTVPASQLNDYEVEAGTYYFFANGVMETEEVRMSGEVVDGKYYVFGELRKDAGLVELANGDFIFVQYSGNVRQSGFQTIKEATCNGHTEYIGVKKFVDGVMVK